MKVAVLTHNPLESVGERACISKEPSGIDISGAIGSPGTARQIAFTWSENVEAFPSSSSTHGKADVMANRSVSHHFIEKKTLSFLGYKRTESPTDPNVNEQSQPHFPENQDSQEPRHMIAPVPWNHECRLDDVLIAPVEQVILVDASHSFVHSLGGQVASRFLVRFTSKMQPVFISIWFLDCIFCLVSFLGTSYIPPWVCSVACCITSFYLAILMIMLQKNVVKRIIMNFETSYLLIIALLNSYFLADILCWNPAYMSSVVACYFSFTFGIFMDGNSISFKKFDQGFNDALLKNFSLEEQDQHSLNTPFILNHPTLNTAISGWVNAVVDKQNGRIRHLITQLSVMNLFHPWYQYVITALCGITNQLGIYIMIRYDLMPQKCIRTVKIMWMEWDSDEILLLLCAHLVLFLTKRIVIMALRPGRVAAIKRNMMMIPLVPYWHHIDLCIQSLENRGKGPRLEVSNQSISRNFEKLAAYFKEHRLLALFCPSSIYSFPYQPKQTHQFSEKLEKILSYVHSFWFYLWMFSIPVSVISLSCLDKNNFPFFGFVCSAGFMYGTKYFRGYCYKILFESVYSFENVYVFLCFNLACFSLADYLTWSSPKTYISVPLIYLVYFHSLFHGAKKRDNETFNNNLRRLFQDNFDEINNTPFTRHLLQSIRCYGAYVNSKSQRLLPGAIQYDHNLYPTINLDELESHDWSVEYIIAPFPRMTRKEWWVYTKLFGTYHLFMNWISVILTIAIYITIETENISTGEERIISLGILNLSNRAVLNSSLSNLFLFCLKRSLASTFNPFVVSLFEVDHLRIPIVISLLKYMKYLQESSKSNIT